MKIDELNDWIMERMLQAVPLVIVLCLLLLFGVVVGAIGSSCHATAPVQAKPSKSARLPDTPACFPDVAADGSRHFTKKGDGPWVERGEIPVVLRGGDAPETSSSTGLLYGSAASEGFTFTQAATTFAETSGPRLLLFGALNPAQNEVCSRCKREHVEGLRLEVTDGDRLLFRGCVWCLAERLR